jgi:Protein of unknown function (DUF2752)
MNKDPYIVINVTIVILLMIMFGYCFLFSILNDQGLTVPSSCEGMPEIYCRSRGLTRAFAQMTHLNFKKGIAFNSHAYRLFIFFVVQIFLRVAFTFWYLNPRGKRIVVIDSVFSGLYFLYAFLPLTFIYYWLFEK